MSVLLVTMPCASVERPPLGITLLQAGLRSRGIDCDLAHLNLRFAEMLGLHEYRRFTRAIPYGTLAGDWAFSACLFGAAAPEPAAYVDEVLRDRYHLSPEQVELVLRVRSLAPAFLKKCLAETAWAEYEVVGFTACGPQNVASLALARLIKSAYPHVVIAAGGGNWHGEMGVELHARFPAVDIAFLGESDLSFPAAVLALRDGGGQLHELPGVAVRQRVSSPVLPPDAVEDLDEVAPPDYGDYFAALSAYGFDRSLRPALQMETARGCSWAEKSPCAFCGLSGPTRRYRTKSATRVLAELRRLAALDCSLVELVDNVVSPAFLSTVLPTLAAHPLPVPLFFEARPHVTKDQVRDMAAASASFQPGIESFSDHMLRLMHKGGRGLEGIRLLKWCRASGVRVCWNLIYGIPASAKETTRRCSGWCRRSPSSSLRSLRDYSTSTGSARILRMHAPMASGRWCRLPRTPRLRLASCVSAAYRPHLRLRLPGRCRRLRCCGRSP